MTRVTEATIRRPARPGPAVSLCLRTADGDVGTASRELAPGMAGFVAEVATAAAAPVLDQPLDELCAELAGVRAAVDDRATEAGGRGFGVARSATNLVVDALWDLWARATGRPLWKLVVDLSPEALLRCIDLDAVGGSLTRVEAAELLGARLRGRSAREADLRRDGYPAAAVVDGPPPRARAAAEELVSAGHRVLVVPVEHGPGRAGAASGAADPRPARNAPAVTVFLAPTRPWSSREALEQARTTGTAAAGLLEPIDSRDIAGLARLRAARAASGEAGPIGAGARSGHPLIAAQLVTGRVLDLFRLDPHRLGVSDSLAVLLLAARHNLPVCPVGPPGGTRVVDSLALHLGVIDVIAMGATVDRRWIDAGRLDRGPVDQAATGSEGRHRRRSPSLRGGRIGMPERHGAGAVPAPAVDAAPSGARR